MPMISAVIITFNEEKYIEQCIRSVAKIADEVLVVDSYSTDKTKEISQQLGARFIQHPFNGYSDQKNYAIKQATYDHILSLDADEVLSIGLEESILNAKINWQYDAYKFSRLNYYCGQWINHTDWYPDRKIRLFDRRVCRWQGQIHETIKIASNSKAGRLKGDLLHWRYNTYEEHLEEINRFSTLSAHRYFEEGRSAGFLKILVHPLWRFFHSYIIKGGFLDGYNGFTISRLSAFMCLSKYVKLRKLYSSIIYGNQSVVPGGTLPATSGMRIGFDSKRAFYNRSGLGNYSRNLLNSLMRSDTQASYFLFTPKIKRRILLASEAESSAIIISPSRFFHKTFKSLWRTMLITSDIEKCKIDLFHGLSHELPFGITKTGAKSVVTIHDLIFLRYPEFYGKVDVFIYRKKMEYACRVADKIVAISTQTRDDLIQFLNVDPGKIEVIYQSCNLVFQKKITDSDYLNIKQKHNLPDNYLLYVGTIEKRKNLLNILKALKSKKIDIPLVAIGRKTEYYHKTIKPFLDENKMDIIIFPSEVNNDELPALYQNALCFVYPSFFEGFGIPILEAITSGIPVITSKGSCFEESGGPGSIYVDPHNPDEIGDAILKVAGSSEIRASMIKTGYEHARLFSSDVIAERYMDLYKKLLTNYS